jgi:hypothetical protein
MSARLVRIIDHKASIYMCGPKKELERHLDLLAKNAEKRGRTAHRISEWLLRTFKLVNGRATKERVYRIDQ